MAVLMIILVGVLTYLGRKLQGTLARHRDGPLFRGRYKAILIDAEEYFLSVVRYIHKNPLGANVVSDIDRYRWSSHWGYLNKSQCPDWLDTRSVMSRFDGLKEYQRFMHEEIEEEIEEFYQGPYQRPLLGSKEFIGRVKQRLARGFWGRV